MINKLKPNLSEFRRDTYSNFIKIKKEHGNFKRVDWNDCTAYQTEKGDTFAYVVKLTGDFGIQHVYIRKDIRRINTQ